MMDVEDVEYLPRPYCTQPRRKEGEGCESCSLGNYGRDCRNNPIATEEEVADDENI